MNQSSRPQRPAHLAAPCLHRRYGRMNRALLDALEGTHTVDSTERGPAPSRAMLTAYLKQVCGTATASRYTGPAFTERLDLAAQVSSPIELIAWAEWLAETREAIAAVETRLRDLVDCDLQRFDDRNRPVPF